MKTLISLRNGCIALAAILGIGGLGGMVLAQGQQILTTLVATDYIGIQHGTYLTAISAPNRLCMASIRWGTAFGATLNPNVTRGASGQRRVSASMSIRN